MTPARARSLARALLTTAAISAVIVLGAELIVDPLPITASVRTVIDLLRFIGPPLALVTALLALLHARRLERGRDASHWRGASHERGRGAEPERTRAARVRGRAGAARDIDDDRADAIFRGLVVVAVLLMAVGLLSALWSTAVLTAGSLLP